MRIALHFRMLLLIQSSQRLLLTTGFTTIHPRHPTQLGRHIRNNNNNKITQLRANFMEDLQKAFSTVASNVMSNGNTIRNDKYYTIAITGSGGLIGTALRDEIRRRGNTLQEKPIRWIRLSRGAMAQQNISLDETITETTVQWNPNGSSADEILCPSITKELDAVVHLAGESIATGLGPLGFLGLRPWTEEKKNEILNSRTILTSALAKVLASSDKPTTFFSASGVGVYGYNFIDETMEAVDETMDVAKTKGFLADVSRAWESAAVTSTNSSNSKNKRVVCGRFGVVLSKNGGALGKLYPIFFLGGGGNVGSGQQYFSYISARDIARAIVHTLETPSLNGPVNFCAPNPCTNAEFTQALGKAMGRPTILPLPSFVVSLLFGEMGEETLLGGVRCIPSKLEKSGFQFQHPTVDSAVQSALEESI